MLLNISLKDHVTFLFLTMADNISRFSDDESPLDSQDILLNPDEFFIILKYIS